MEIRSILALEGANVFSSRPVIKMLLHLGPWTGIFSNEIEGFVTKLTALVPSLEEHFCSRGKPGGFVERLKEGTLLGHVVEHVALEIMSLSGQKVIYGKTLGTDEIGLYEIVMEYEVKEGAIQAARSAVALVDGLLAGGDLSLQAELDKVKTVMLDSELGQSAKAIVEACRRRDIPVIRLDGASLLQLGYGKHQKRMEATITANTGCIGVDIAGDKTLTKQLLAEMGISVPFGMVVGDEEEAVRAAETIGGPVAIKPCTGNQGKGVALNLTGQAEIRRACSVALGYSNRVIVEKYIRGRHFRLLVVGERVEAVAERIPANVIGDGRLSINSLIKKENLNPQRGEGHERPLTKLKLDPLALMLLSKQGLGPNSIPALGQVVYLRENANLSTGGVAIDVTDEAHPSHREIALRAARIIGLDVAGIDLVTEDISQPYSHKSSAIIEVNAAPGIRMHHYPFQGKPRKVAEKIVNNLFPLGAPSRVPVVSVTGTNGKTTTTRLIAHILARRKLVVGMANSDGIWIGENRVIEGDTTGPASSKVVLRDTRVEAAVLETARGGILRAGLGYDFADVAVITNISEDHFGQYGIETLGDLAHVKSVVAEAVRKHSFVVLNADDPYVAKMSAHTKGKIVFFSVANENSLIRQHLGAGGAAVFIRRGRVIVAVGSEVTRVGSIKSFPVTLEGKAVHNVQNVLAAVGAAWALGIPGEEIGNHLQSFYSNQWDNPGRLNIFDVNNFKVMIDYGHNAAGIEQIISFARKLKPRRLIGVITVPGDRPNDSIHRVGMLSAKGFDYLFVREDRDLRGRTVGEVAGILASGARAGGMSEKCLRTILPETEAFTAALNHAKPGDMVINFYETLEPVLECLNQYLAEHGLTEGESPVRKQMVL